ncbi:MAG: dihydrodipicolinate synthase family protein [Williamsia sp.]|nr:dihydrodipicolinate synthase family protein [Williamsia sp.]
MNQKEKGFIPVMLTPFKENGAVDFDGLDNLTDLYLASGASGLFANCLSSEMFELTEKERMQTIERVVKKTNGAVPVVATGTFDGSPAEQARFIKRVYEAGCDAVIFITGILARETEPDEVLAERIYRLFELTPGIPTGVYECPVPYKRLLSPTLLKTLIDTGRVVYHKDTSLDLQQVALKVKAGEGHPFGLYDAYMVHAVKSLRAGAAGLSCIQGNYFPELIVWLCRNYDDPAQSREVDKVQQFLTDNMDVMHDVYPASSKIFLQKRGIEISHYTRRDVGELTADKLNKIDILYKDYEELQHELQIPAVY